MSGTVQLGVQSLPFRRICAGRPLASGTDLPQGSPGCCACRLYVFVLDVQSSTSVTATQIAPVQNLQSLLCKQTVLFDDWLSPSVLRRARRSAVTAACENSSNGAEHRQHEKPFVLTTPLYYVNAGPLSTVFDVSMRSVPCLFGLMSVWTVLDWLICHGVVQHLIWDQHTPP